MSEASKAMSEASFVPARAETLGQIVSVAEVMVKSGLFPTVRSVHEAAAKMVLGQTLGIGPIDSLTGISVVDGKPVLGVHLLSQLVKRGGYDYRLLRWDDSACEIAYFRQGEEIGRASFTIEDAKRAGLLGRQNWQRYPREMLYARAMARGARTYCPDAVGGHVYVPGELDDQHAEAPEAVVPAPVETPSVEAPREEPVHVPQDEPDGFRHVSGLLAQAFPVERIRHGLVLEDEDRFAAKSAKSRVLAGKAFGDLTEEEASTLARQSDAVLASWGLARAEEGQ